MADMLCHGHFVLFPTFRTYMDTVKFSECAGIRDREDSDRSPRRQLTAVSSNMYFTSCFCITEAYSSCCRLITCIATYSFRSPTLGDNYRADYGSLHRQRRTITGESIRSPGNSSTSEQSRTPSWRRPLTLYRSALTPTTSSAT